MADSNSQLYFDYLNKLVKEYSNTYHRSIGKKLADVDYSALPEEIEMNSEAPELNVRDIVRISKERSQKTLVKRNIFY